MRGERSARRQLCHIFNLDTLKIGSKQNVYKGLLISSCRNWVVNIKNVKLLHQKIVFDEIIGLINCIL